MISAAVLPAVLATAAVSLILLHVRYIRRERNFRKVRSKVNHDLRSPLNAVIGFSDLLLQTEKDTEKIKFLSAIKSGGEAILSLLDEISTILDKSSYGCKRPLPAKKHDGIKLTPANNLENSSEALILIVDDMVENVIFLEKVLQKSGFRTISALNGDAALDLLTEYTPDLILLDIVMPGISGFETCARIQSNRDFIDIPVIFLSTKKDERTIIESFIYGGIDYIVKPFNSPELLARINTHLQLKNAKEKLHILAFTDSLTGLQNRRKFIEIVDHERARAVRYKEELSFIMIDIDHFKLINDEFGHETGDKALIRFANIIKSNLREADSAGRLGGEEFGIILPKTSIKQAEIVAERIRSRIESESGSKKEGVPFFTASFGIAQLREGSNTSDLFTQSADRALYKAKETGRNKVCLAEEN